MSDTIRVACWQTLVRCAKAYKDDDAASRTALSNAAYAWTKANAKADPQRQGGSAQAFVNGPRRGASTGGGPVFPNYGKNAGKPISGASPGDLKFYRNGAMRTLNDESKSKYHDKENALLDAIEAEMDSRGIARE